MVDWWSYPTNFSNGSIVDTPSELFIKYPASIFSNNLGIFLIIIMWSIFFGLGLVSGVRKSLMVSSFITFIFSIYFVRLGELNPLVSIVLIILTIIGAIGSKEEGGL
jgi:hypothetical protein